MENKMKNQTLRNESKKFFKASILWATLTINLLPLHSQAEQPESIPREIPEILIDEILEAAGDRVGNGGDECERKLLRLQTEIKEWVNQYDINTLDLPGQISHSEYRERMNLAIDKTYISCTDRVLRIGGAEKTCINAQVNEYKNALICNINKVDRAREEELLTLQHHEYAGLASIETNDGDERSNYFITNQLSGYMERVNIVKLAIRPTIDKSLKSKNLEYLFENGYGLEVKVIKDIKFLAGRNTAFFDSGIYSQPCKLKIKNAPKRSSYLKKGTTFLLDIYDRQVDTGGGIWPWSFDIVGLSPSEENSKIDMLKIANHDGFLSMKDFKLCSTHLKVKLVKTELPSL